jgi:Amt family ammonium transporter
MKHLLTLLAALPAAAFAAESEMNAADVSWMLVATILVLFMTIPGIALFYGGMVRKKNVLSVLLQSFAICCAISVLWFVCGYSLSFSEENFFIGNFSKAFFNGIGINAMSGSIPELLFVMFQMTFAILTPALMCGAFAERIKFSALFLFIVLWSLFCYAPICHWVWASDGWLMAKGALDYAGGTVVHINAGVAGLVVSLVLGKRIGWRKEPMAPHNLVLALMGASFLWVGWFGFNGGSGLAADARAVMAIVVSQIAAAAAALAWMACEYIQNKRFTVLGTISGAIAGLVAITPASGFVEPMASLWIGIAGGVICYFGATWLKYKLGYDDSLDAFGVHGIGGIVGALLTGVFVSPAITGEAVKPMIEQLLVQGESVVATVIYSALVTFILIKIVDKLIGIRVSKDEEREGLDLSLHGERVE